MDEVQEAFERVASFKEYNEKYLKALKVIGGVFVFIQSIHISTFWHYRVRSDYGYRNRYPLRSTILLAAMIFFSSLPFKYETVHRKFLGERAWICHSIWFKALKWVLVIIWVMFMVLHFIPYYYSYYGERLLGHGEYAEMVVKRLTPFYYFDLFYVCAVILASDIEDFYRRRLCEEMSDRFSLRK